ncbi:late competence development ComFB family protein [Brevibacillus sp. H7]|jgi:competence protein ComFB|uniref:late competence development ComFB family protein n=1 Tax=Brevibacillus sp. H7 TaxID=3349138 RepID=UPI00380993F3
MNFVNSMEPIVQDLFGEYVKKSPLACSCPRCQMDVLVIALNRLPSRYVSSLQGEVYMKTQLLNSQLRSDVMRELAYAAQIVADNPHH